MFFLSLLSNDWGSMAGTRKLQKPRKKHLQKKMQESGRHKMAQPVAFKSSSACCTTRSCERTKPRTLDPELFRATDFFGWFFDVYVSFKNQMFICVYDCFDFFNFSVSASSKPMHRSVAASCSCLACSWWITKMDRFGSICFIDWNFAWFLT